MNIVIDYSSEDRIAKIENTESKEYTYSDWEDVIKSNFPDLLEPAKLILATISQILIKDIRNPFGVILIGASASGKSLTLNLFDGIEPLTYSTDKFTPRAFVSSAANVAREKLPKVDLLTRVRYRTMLVRDMATIFSKGDDELTDLLGTLTRVLDGEGLTVDSGIHGQRGYKGDFLLMFVGASTPIQPRIWRIMGNLGSRLFFYRLKAEPKNLKALTEQLTSEGHSTKQTICNEASKRFLHTLWSQNQDGIAWNRGMDNTDCQKIISTLALFLSRMRGQFPKDEENKKPDLSSEPHLEHPTRINQLFYNLARGHAVIKGRTRLELEDLGLILELALDSGTPKRSRFIRKLLDFNGQMTTTQIISELYWEQPTALHYMRELERLGICVIKDTLKDSAGRPEKTICLKEEWNWLISDEAKSLKELL